MAPDLFHRFTGDRQAVLRGEQRVDLTDDGALEDLDAAVEYLKKTKEVDGERIGIIGVCQTGRQPVLLAARRNDIAGAVVLYGAIGGREWQGNEIRPTPIEDLIAQVNCPVLGIFGEADHIISIDDVVRFRNCLEKAKKNCHIRIYAGAPHGWLNDTMMVDKYSRFATENTIAISLAELTAQHFCWAVEDSLPMAQYLATAMQVPVALLDAPWNRTESQPPGVSRYRNWRAIADAAPALIECVKDGNR